MRAAIHVQQADPGKSRIDQRRRDEEGRIAFTEYRRICKCESGTDKGDANQASKQADEPLQALRRVGRERSA